MKIGRYIAIINPPISAPNTDMMIGSINELKLSTALSTASIFADRCHLKKVNLELVVLNHPCRQWCYLSSLRGEIALGFLPAMMFSRKLK